jgi:hypothetical protein
MTDIAFSQPERRNYLIPALIVAVIVAIAFALIYFFTPHRIADLTVTHTAILPTHTVFKTESKLVGHEDQIQDDLYVLATVRIDDKLKLPVFIKDITATLTTADDTVIDTSAIEKTDLDNLYITFPKLKPLASAPLLRESTIEPGGSAEGMVLLHFPITEADWNNRKSVTITIDLYHQGSQTVTIPKP